MVIFQLKTHPFIAIIRGLYGPNRPIYPFIELYKGYKYSHSYTYTYTYTCIALYSLRMETLSELQVTQTSKRIETSI
jgi:hypothetical protein